MKNAHVLRLTFENPNNPADFEKAFRKILLEKLLSEFAYSEKSPACFPDSL